MTISAPNAASREDRAAYVLLLLMALCFGGTWVAGKVAVDSIPPMTVAASRFGLASALLWLWKRSLPVTTRRPGVADLPLILAMGLTAIAGYNILFLYGLTLAPASDGAIIVPGMAPVLTAALAWPALGDRIGRRGMAGLAVALAGLLLVVTPEGSQPPSRLLGDVLFLLGAGAWAIYGVIGRAATARFGSVGATLYGTIAGTVVLLPFALAERGWERLAAASAMALSGLIYLAVVGTVLAFVLLYEGIKRIGATRASAFALLVPIFGVLSSVVLLGDDLAPKTLLGGVFVLLGLWLVQSAPARSKAAGPEALRAGAREATAEIGATSSRPIR